jgi:hypothetical protein
MGKQYTEWRISLEPGVYWYKVFTSKAKAEQEIYFCKYTLGNRNARVVKVKLVEVKK